MTMSQPGTFTAATNKWAYAQAFTNTSVSPQPRTLRRAAVRRLVGRRPHPATDKLVLPALHRPVTH